MLGVTALDRDEGDNAQLVYTMFGSDDVNRFVIDQSTGVITAKNQLTKTSGGYRFNVRATDKGQNPPL